VRSDGRLAVSACYDKVKVWDLETGRELYTLEGHASWAGLVRGVAVSPDGQRAASASYDKTLKVWDLETGRELRTLEGHSEWVLGVAVSPDGQRAASASRDKTLKVWDLKTWRDLRTLQGHTRDINGVAMSPDGSRAVSASDDHTLKVWDLETGTALATFTCDAEVRSCGYALGGRLIAGDALGRVYFLCLEDSKGPSVDAEGPHPGIDCGSRKL
jgi:WD40 repeat protein